MIKKLKRSKWAAFFAGTLLVLMAFHPLALAQEAPPHEEGLEQGQEHLKGVFRELVTKLKAIAERFGVSLINVFEKVKEFVKNFGGNFNDALAKAKEFFSDSPENSENFYDRAKLKLSNFFQWQKRMIKEQFGKIKF